MINAIAIYEEGGKRGVLANGWAGKGDKVVLRGSSGVALAAGFNWYLQQVCDHQMNWCGSRLDLQRLGYRFH